MNSWGVGHMARITTVLHASTIPINLLKEILWSLHSDHHNKFPLPSISTSLLHAISIRVRREMEGMGWGHLYLVFGGRVVGVKEVSTRVLVEQRHRVVNLGSKDRRLVRWQSHAHIILGYSGANNVLAQEPLQSTLTPTPPIDHFQYATTETVKGLHS